MIGITEEAKLDRFVCDLLNGINAVRKFAAGFVQRITKTFMQTHQFLMSKQGIFACVIVQESRYPRQEGEKVPVDLDIKLGTHPITPW
jgi:hypothetical protein